MFEAANPQKLRGYTYAADNPVPHSGDGCDRACQDSLNSLQDHVFKDDRNDKLVHSSFEPSEAALRISFAVSTPLFLCGVA
ncbi:hypothetical protein ACH47Z_39735 [Streptomyces sp. NPDC020192]|uniref:hypothetical protein n=1 Tax=Streptomyces sp. NPDC020192 TaxID=3365066 RepID=UPI0037A01F6D